jgi:hypothetical protein
MMEYLPRRPEPVFPAWSNMPQATKKGERRPAYTDETLADMLRTGVDPAGKRLDDIMPLYMLDDRDMALLIHYLKNLSSDFSPGVTDKTLKFATVIAGDVRTEDREAMLSVLEAFLDDRNAQHRGQKKRASKGVFYRQFMDSTYRTLELARWELTGPRETWRSQLEEYYRAEPVFAILGGIAEGGWSPIHGFCEENRIPCLFPVTDLPVVSDSDWYTLYFSKGFYQEGEAAARYLREKVTGDMRVVQVYRDGGGGALAARGFRATCGKIGLKSPEDRTIAADEKISRQILGNLLKSRQKTVLLLWLEREDLAALGHLAELPHRPETVFVSAGLLGDDLSSIAENTRSFVYITHPYSVPRDKEKIRFLIKRWMKTRNIPVININIQSRMYFVGWMLSESLMHMRDDFYRNYMLDGIDMMNDETYSIAVYPRVSFGPGQRYAAKGCYIVQLTEGPDPQLIRRSNWVIH